MSQRGRISLQLLLPCLSEVGTGQAWLLQELFNYEDGIEGILVDPISQTASSETRLGPQQASNKIRTLTALFRDGRSILL